MAKNSFILADATVDHIAKAEASISSLKADNKANNEVANEQKIGAYCELIASLASVKLVKGKLPRAISKQVKEALLGACKEATAKRYLENSVGALRLFSDELSSQATPSLVKELFDDPRNDITSENKLAKLVSGEAEKSKAQRLAESVVGKWSTKKDDAGRSVQGDVFKDGLSDEELDEFQNAFRELMAAREAYRNAKAAKDAEAAAAEENGDVDAVVAMLEDAGVA